MAQRRAPPIINTRTIPYRDGSTLIWYKDQDTANKKFKLWTGVVTSLSDYAKWCGVAPLLAVVLHELPEADLPLLQQYRSAIPHLFVKQEIMTKYELTKCHSIESLPTQYPIIKPCSSVVADTIAAVGLLFHFTQFVDIPCSPEWAAYVTSLNITQSVDSMPPTIYLITQYFVHKITKRAKEFRQCLKNNLACAELDHVILLNEENLSHEWSGMRGSEKVTQAIIGARLTYKHLLKYVYESVPLNSIVIFANADIYCTKTLAELYTVNMRDKMFALLRWDEQTGSEDLKLFGPRSDSQDAWILHSNSIKERTWDWSAFDYKLGIAGCDNKFTGDMFGMKFLVSNPCQSIKMAHLHKTEIRDYNKHDILAAKLYMYVYPCSITYMEQSRTAQSRIGKLENRTTTVQIRSLNPKQAETFVVMLAREKRYTWSSTVPTVRTDPALEITKWDNTFVSPAGLVYDYKKTYIGPSEKADRFITKSDIQFKTAFFSPIDQLDTMLAVPVALQLYFNHPDMFCLHYLSYVLQLYRKFPDIDFSIYLPTALVDLAKTFVVCPTSNGPLKAVAWNPETTAYAKTVYGYLPEVFELSVNEISALRSAWPPYQTTMTDKCIVLTDDILTDDFVTTELAPLFPYPIVCVSRRTMGLQAYEKLVGAKVCILYNLPKQDGEWSKLWCLPKGCAVLEFQNELKVVGEFQHFAAAAELNCWLMPLHKGPVEDLRGQIRSQVADWLKL